MTELADRHVYSWVMFYTDTFRFYLEGVKFYERRLQADLKAFQDDDDLSVILDKATVESMPIHQELSKVRKTIDWMEQCLKKAGSEAWDLDVSLSHGMVRFLKSTSLLYLQQLKHRRNVIASRPSIARCALEAVDARLSRLEETTRLGVFADATVLDLLAPIAVDTHESEQLPESPELLTVSLPRPVVVGSIEILDGELRTRCLDLYETFKADGTPERFDTVLTEATRILENRLRAVSKLPSTTVGVDLARAAFCGATPVVRVSTIPAEQEAAHLLYRGVFGFIRNSVHHKLVGHVSAERVLQVVGFVDYLLFLIDGADVTGRETT